MAKHRMLAVDFLMAALQTDDSLRFRDSDIVH